MQPSWSHSCSLAELRASFLIWSCRAGVGKDPVPHWEASVGKEWTRANLSEPSSPGETLGVSTGAQQSHTCPFSFSLMSFRKSNTRQMELYSSQISDRQEEKVLIAPWLTEGTVRNIPCLLPGLRKWVPVLGRLSAVCMKNQHYPHSGPVIPVLRTLHINRNI